MIESEQEDEIIAALVQSGQSILFGILVNGSKELKMADALLAKTTKADADLLAKTTKADAVILAQATERAANDLRRSNEASVRWMTRMTIAMLVVGLIQIIVTAMPYFK